VIDGFEQRSEETVTKMEFSRDEVRRQLAASKRDQADALPRFREALKRLFDPDGGASDEDRRALLGLPSRRGFLTIGGATVVGSAILVGCGQSPSPQVAQTGTLVPPPSSTTTVNPGSPETDLSLLMTSSSIEVLAVNTYQTILDKGWLTDQTLKDGAKLFQDQHRQHAEELYSATTDAGGQPYKEPNLYLSYEVVAPTLATTSTQDDAIALAITLEDTAAQTYVYAGGVLTTPALRGAIMSIGTTEARHLTTLYIASGMVPVPLSIFPDAKAAPTDAFIQVNDGKGQPTKPKDLLPTPTTVAKS
jgi:hypothetical protein